MVTKETETVIDDYIETVDYDLFVRSNKKMNKLSVKEPCKKRLRILPPGQLGLFCQEFGAHYDLPGLIPAAALDAIACLKLTLQQACPVCAEVRRLYNEADATKNQDLQDKATRHRCKSRWAMNVIDLDDLEAGVQIWDINKEVFGWIKELFNEDKFIVSGHPTKGKAVEVTFARKSKWVAPSQMKIAAEQYHGAIPIADWKEQLNDLEEYVRRFTVTADTIRGWAAESARGLSAAPVESPIEIGDEEGTLSDEDFRSEVQRQIERGNARRGREA